MFSCVVVCLCVFVVSFCLFFSERTRNFLFVVEILAKIHDFLAV